MARTTTGPDAQDAHTGTHATACTSPIGLTAPAPRASVGAWSAGGTDSSGLQGFGSGLAGGASLAIAAYQAQQDYGTGTLGSDVTSKAAESPAASTATPAPTATPDPVTAAYLQAVAQANLSATNLSLLA